MINGEEMIRNSTADEDMNARPLYFLYHPKMMFTFPEKSKISSEMINVNVHSFSLFSLYFSLSLVLLLVSGLMQEPLLLKLTSICLIIPLLYKFIKPLKRRLSGGRVLGVFRPSFCRSAWLSCHTGPLTLADDESVPVRARGLPCRRTLAAAQYIIPSVHSRRLTTQQRYGRKMNRLRNSIFHSVLMVHRRHNGWKCRL